MIQEFTLPLHRFDLNLLPPDARQIGSEAFQNAVAMHFAMAYATSGQGAIVTVDDTGIKVMTYPIDADPLDMVMPMLQAGRLAEAVPYLEALTKQVPDHAQVLYNLGICYSELGQFDEAIIRLKRTVQLEPKHVHAWVGIGTAYYRLRKPDQAAEAFTKAVELDPSDAYARRNLGGALTAAGEPAKALPHLRLALQDMPDDPQSIFGLACALVDIGTESALKEADGLFLRVIEEHRTSPAAALAEKARTELAHKQLSQSAIGGIRFDVVAYLSEALLIFKKAGPKKAQQVALEISVLGRSGLDINDPDKKYKLNSLPGSFSGLQLLCYLYAAFKQIDPAEDIGADFAQEYALASGNVR